MVKSKEEMHELFPDIEKIFIIKGQYWSWNNSGHEGWIGFSGSLISKYELNPSDCLSRINPESPFFDEQYLEEREEDDHFDHRASLSMVSELKENGELEGTDNLSIILMMNGLPPELSEDPLADKACLWQG